MARDHYIPRVITKPWEHDHSGDKRQFTYFDFGTGEVDVKSSRNLFSDENLHGSEAETMLGKYIDQPLADYVKEHRRSGGLLDVPEEEHVRRALLLLIPLNSHRLAESRRDPRIPVTLDQVAENEQLLVELGRMLASRYEVGILTLPDDQELFFTNVGLFPIPFRDGAPAFGVPLSLRQVVVSREGSLMHGVEWDAYNQGGFVQLLSLGVGSKVSPVVLPPSWRARFAAEPDEAARRLVRWRKTGRAFIQVMTGATPD